MKMYVKYTVALSNTIAQTHGSLRQWVSASCSRVKAPFTKKSRRKKEAQLTALISANKNARDAGVERDQLAARVKYLENIASRNAESTAKLAQIHETRLEETDASLRRLEAIILNMDAQITVKERDAALAKDAMAKAAYNLANSEWVHDQNTRLAEELEAAERIIQAQSREIEQCAQIAQESERGEVLLLSVVQDLMFTAMRSEKENIIIPHALINERSDSAYVADPAEP
jgi:hypothetical protein